MSVETNAVVSYLLTYLCIVYVSVCLRVCACFDLYNVCMCLHDYVLVLCVSLSFSGPLSAPFGPWRCGL